MSTKSTTTIPVAGDAESELILLSPEDIAINPKLAALRSNRHSKEYEDGIKRLAAQLKEPNGQIQPVTIRPYSGPGEQSYELVAGHRRHAAAVLAGVGLLCRYSEMDEAEAMKWARQENFSREDFSPLEKARIIITMQEEEKLTPKQIAAELGVSVATVTQTKKLLTLDKEIQDKIESGVLTPSNALDIAATVEVGMQPEVVRVAERAAEEEVAVSEKRVAAKQAKGERLSKKEKRQLEAKKEGKVKIESKHVRKAIRETKGARVEGAKAPNRSMIIEMCEELTGPGQVRPVSDLFTVMVGWIKGDVKERVFKGVVDDLAEAIDKKKVDKPLAGAKAIADKAEKEVAKKEAAKTAKPKITTKPLKQIRAELKKKVGKGAKVAKVKRVKAKAVKGGGGKRQQKLAATSY